MQLSEAKDNGFLADYYRLKDTIRTSIYGQSLPPLLGIGASTSSNAMSIHSGLLKDLRYSIVENISQARRGNQPPNERCTVNATPSSRNSRLDPPDPLLETQALIRHGAYATSVLNVGEIWRQALLCYIYTELCALPTGRIRLQQYVAAAMSVLQRLTSMQCVLWPVFMVGLHATNPEDQLVIEKGLQTMSLLHHFRTPLSLIDIFSSGLGFAREGLEEDCF